MPRVRVITGTARSDRANAIDALLAEAPGRSLLIVPTEQHAQRQTGSLIDATGQPAFLDPPVVTFEGLVRRILRNTPLEHARIDPLAQHLLLRRVIERAHASGALANLGAAAQTDGFLNHLLSVIGQLKQAAIEPNEFRERITRAKQKRPMDGAVATVYAAYQDELQRANAVDLQGMYWLARNVCEASCPRALAHIDHLLLDEFDDFTPSEFRVILEAARHVGDVTFGLNLDMQPKQRDLYAIPLETMIRIRDAFPDGVEVTDLPDPKPARYTEYVSATLLVRDNAPIPNGLVHDLDFVECHTLDHEIETTARRIKRLIRVDGVAPAEIAVVWRRPAAVAPAIRAVFGEFGIPVTGIATRSLGETSLGGFVLRALDATQSWSESNVVDVLISPWMLGTDAAHADTFATLARAARPRPVRYSWERATKRLAEMIAAPGSEEMKKLVRHVSGAADACTAFRATLDRLVAFDRALPQSGKLSEFSASLDAALLSLPIDAVLDAIHDDVERAQESAARDALFRVLAQIHDTAAFHGDRKLTLPEFSRVLRTTFTLAVVPGAEPPNGVACIGMDAARYLTFRHVFLAGMTDGNVPARAPSNALYAEEERAELRALGVSIEDAQQHDRRELLLFQRMFSIADRRLTISWHRIARGGQAAQRSLYIDEIADQMPELLPERPRSPVEVVVPDPPLAACERDVRNVLFRDAHRAKSAATHFPGIASAVAIESARQSVATCGPHDAVLNSAANVESLGAAFGPSTQFSASALETYAQCPFAFFQDRVLHLFAVESTEATLDRRVAGGVLHGALEKFHRAFLHQAVADIDPGEAATAMQQALDAEFLEHTQHMVHLPKGLRDAEKAKLARTLAQYLAIARDAGDDEWKPDLLEASFGRARDGKETPFDPYPLDLGDETVLITGRIDRIDRNGDAIRLVDYKTSRVAQTEIKERRNFQLALYSLAAESQLCAGSQCDSALYLPVGKCESPTIALARSGKSPNWDERVALARAAVASAIRGIRAGRFHPTLRDKPCQRCANEKVCRYEKARMLRKAGP